MTKTEGSENQETRIIPLFTELLRIGMFLQAVYRLIDTPIDYNYPNKCEHDAILGSDDPSENPSDGEAGVGLGNDADGRTVGQIFREKRLRLEKSPTEVARGADVHIPTYLRIESGEIRRPAFDAIERIAEYLNLDPVPLLLRAGHKLPKRLREVAEAMNLTRPDVQVLGKELLTEAEFVFLQKALAAYRDR